MLPTPNQDQPNQALNSPEQDDRERQQRGTGFTNISRILGANQGAGQRMGQAIGSGISQQADSVKQGIAQGQSAFQAGMEGSNNAAQSAISQGQSLVKAGNEDDDTYTKRLAQSKDTNGNAIDYSKIGQNLQNATYTGPSGLANADQVQSQAATAGALNRLAGSSSGQSQLLKNMVAQRGNYSTGQNALDQLLVGREGQSAIQQGRLAANGITQVANDAVSNASNQANATSSTINNDRTGTINTLQNQLSGDNGFMGIAKTQAQDFNTKASQLAKLLSGQWNPQNSDEKAQAQGLLDQMGDYGLDNYNLYDKNESAVKSALANLAGTVSTNNGVYKYTDAQSQAAQNLAALLGQNDIKDRIAKNKFNTKAFGSETDAFGGLDKARTTDTESKNILSGAASSIGALEQRIRDQNTQRYNSEMDSINNRLDLDPASRAAMLDKLNKSYTTSQSMISKRQPLPQTTLPAQPAAPIDPKLDPVGAYNPQFADFTSVRAESDKGIENSLAPYGFLAFGDHGEQDIDPRFAGLGLNAENNISGQYRSVGELQNAANQVLGPDASLKDYVLRKMLGLGSPKDMNDGGGRTLTQK